METANLPDVVMQYLRRGSGKPLVLLHGFPLDSRIWIPIVPLLENDFELILPDLRGFGGSVSSSTQYSLSDMANDVVRLLDQLGTEKAYVAGHSMGGYIALAIAKSHPQRLLGLGLVATQVLPDTPERKESRYQTISQVEEFGLKPLAKSMADKLSINPSLREILLDLILQQPKPGVQGAIKALAERPDQTSTLQFFNKPVVIIHGGGDMLIPLERAREMKELNPNSVLTIFSDAGHMPMMENPVETAAAFLRFK